MPFCSVAVPDYSGPGVSDLVRGRLDALNGRVQSARTSSVSWAPPTSSILMIAVIGKLGAQAMAVSIVIISQKH